MTPGRQGGGDTGVPFLMFHGIDSTEESFGQAEPGELLYVLDKNEFEACLAFMRSEGYRTILLRDFIDWQKGIKDIPHRSIVLTFDDGHASNVTTALPILARNGFVAEFFITTGFVGKPQHVTIDDLARLRESGMGIGSHSVTHPMLNDLPASGIRKELEESKDFLERTLGVRVIGFSAPGGRMVDAVPDLAKAAGYEAILTSCPGTNGRSADPYRLRRIAMKRGVSIARRLVAGGRPGAGERLLQGLYDLGKRRLGNERYDRLRARILRMREASPRSET